MSNFFNIIKPPKTVDEKYTEAKNNLKAYNIESKNIIGLVQKLALQLQVVAKSYQKLTSSASSWWTEGSTPAVQQSLQSIVQAANSFDNITTNKFIAKINPNFAAALNEYDEQIKTLLAIEKRRRDSCKEFDKARERLRQAQAAKEQNQDKITQAQNQTNETQAIYEQVNNEYIESVAKFGEQRKTTLFESIKIYMALLCQYINELSTISYVPFPENLNGPLADKPISSEQQKVEYKAPSPAAATTSTDKSDSNQPIPSAVVTTTTSTTHSSTTSATTTTTPTTSSSTSRLNSNDPYSSSSTSATSTLSATTAVNNQATFDRPYTTNQYVATKPTPAPAPAAAAAPEPQNNAWLSAGGNPFDTPAAQSTGNSNTFGGDDDDDEPYGNPFG